MSATDEILAGINPQQLAAALGTDEATAMNAAAAAIPTLIGSLQANAASTEGSEGLQIPEEDTGDTYDQGSQQQQPQGSGDILGGLLGQILGR